MSTQLSNYLAARSEGLTMMTAAARSGIPVAEARLIENDIARGDVEIPSPAAGPAVQSKEPVMAKKTQPGDRVTNLSETKDIIRNAVPAIINAKERRKAINAEIAELRERVNAAGVSKKALDYAIKVREMEPDDRAHFDEGYAIARDAIGLKMSGSLFDFIETPTSSEPANEVEDATADAAA